MAAMAATGAGPRIDEVPTPELFRWCHDGGETFIHMEYISSHTLKDLWSSFSQEEKDIICEQLRKSVAAWRTLRQETEPYFVVFMHADLDKSNIFVSPREGDSPHRVGAIIDWHQSGWYPSDWGYINAQSRCQPSWEGGRDDAWLSKVMTRAENGYLVAWEFIIGTTGC
ncbi:hypothetical protein F4804DRAFT_331695 [Jackrogersella minutella]|nr:hypothetical protein F4804DRAFT_331695 [Jackrogersella minutella]